MGIDAAGAAFLLAARAVGVDFRETATFGRQTFFPTERGFRPVANAFAMAGGADGVMDHCGWSGDKFIELLGAESVTSFDASHYEEATVVHDMNEPLPKEHRARYSAVFDGGTMEHVFNARQFYENALEMVRPGGHYLGLTCGNNLLGHGFYQFSPEFFYQSLTPENGFDETVVLLCEHDAEPPVFYSVVPPRLAGCRVELVNGRQLYVMAIAKRTEVKPLFATPPQQSDYLVAWQRTAEAPGRRAANAWQQGRKSRPRHLFNKYLPGSARRLVKRMLAHGAEGGLRQKLYRRLSLQELVRGDLRPPAVDGRVP